jgi:hypothetical protein
MRLPGLTWLSVISSEFNDRDDSPCGQAATRAW